jgi:hypothetical protein
MKARWAIWGWATGFADPLQHAFKRHVPLHGLDVLMYSCHKTRQTSQPTNLSLAY